MKTTSSQRWAIGAIALASLIACTPPAPVEPAPPTPQPPTLSGGTTVIAPPPASIDPGFKGTWALVEADCGTPEKIIRMSSIAINPVPGEADCAITAIEEEHPTGRSMIYRIAATCPGDGQPREDRIRLDFGASDTAIQMTVNDGAPLRIVRCPTVPQP